jgi:hypothetical protein
LQRLVGRVLDPVADWLPELRYRLVGTAAAVAQGVQLEAADIDLLLARREDLDRFAGALSSFPCLVPPGWLPEAGQYFARFLVEETEVELSTVERPAPTDTFECAGTGPWWHWVPVELGGHLVPAVRLELRLVTELVRDRPDRSTPLIEHLRMHGADLPLLRRAMSSRGVAPGLRQQVADQLGVPAITD